VIRGTHTKLAHRHCPQKSTKRPLGDTFRAQVTSSRCNDQAVERVEIGMECQDSSHVEHVNNQLTVGPPSGHCKQWRPQSDLDMEVPIQGKHEKGIASVSTPVSHTPIQVPDRELIKRNLQPSLLAWLGAASANQWVECCQFCLTSNSPCTQS
jgi:hypothetical protein